MANTLALVPAPRVELTILILCRDEEGAIARCVSEARGFLERRAIAFAEILVVDNGSQDRSAALAREAGARVISETRAGYGNAIKAGVAAARGRFIILSDGDGEHDLGALDMFWEKLQDGCDLVVGNRFLEGRGSDATSRLRRVGNLLLTGIGKVLFRVPVGDFHCGLRGFSASAIRTLALQCPGMELAGEIIVKAAYRRMRIAEVPTVQRRALDPRRSSHLRPWRDGWRHLRLLLLLSPKWLFLSPGAVLLATGALAVTMSVVDPAEDGGNFGAYTMLFGSVLCLLGTQLFGLYLSAVIHLESLGLIEGRLTSSLRGHAVLEVCLIAAFTLVAAGIACAAWSLGVWAEGGDAGTRMRLLIAAATGVILGTQVMFNGFLVSLLVTQAARR